MDAVRETALKTLYEVEKNGAYSNIALKNELAKKRDFSSRDRRFITMLVYGVIDKRLTLDYAIEQYSKIKLKKLSPYILIILRMGIYQILFMDKIPQSAAVNESVTLAKRYGHRASSGYVNGVLRSVIRGGIKYPENESYLSVKYSYPEWLVNMWLEDFGYEFAKQLMEAFAESPKLSLRPNALKITAEELCEKLAEHNGKMLDGAVICDGFDIAENELYRNGYFSVQDKAAQDAAKILAPEPGDSVIDMCAAPGGKTAHMAEIMENKGSILAFDIYAHKTELIEKNAERLGIDIIKTRVCDASEYDAGLTETADRVLCDVPCSGLGIIGRKPEIKWNRREDLTELCKTQKRILKNGAGYVKKNGALVYSTCTINKRENEEVISAFLAENDGFEKEFEKTYYPQLDKTDGFYICKLKRKE